MHFGNSSLRKGLLSSSLDISISYKITTWAYCELVHKLMFSQSINQLINQSINQSINQPINQSINQSV